MTFPKGENAVVVPLKEAQGLFLARLAVGGLDAGWFLVDTGANYTVLAKATAKRLGLEATKEIDAVSTLAGPVEMTRLTADNVSIGGIAFEGLRG